MHLRVEICTCWTGGGKSSHFSIPQLVLWNSPRLPASDNRHFSHLATYNYIYAQTALRCYLWHLHSIQTRGCSGSQRPFIQDAPDYFPFDRITSWFRLERTLGGHLVQIPWASRASCLGPGTSSFWVCPKMEIPQRLWETSRASTVCSMHEHKWMLHLGCCKLEIPILPLCAGVQPLLCLKGTAIAELMAKQKSWVSPWVTLWQLKKKFHSTKYLHSIPQKLCIQKSWKICLQIVFWKVMYVLTVIGVSTVKKSLLIGVNLRLWRSYCLALMQLDCIRVPLYTDMLFRSNSADFIRITSPAFVCWGYTPESIVNESCLSELFCKWYPKLMDPASFQINLEIRLL